MFFIGNIRKYLGGTHSMKKLLVTGGTVFVSKYVAEYFVKKGYDVYVLNRNHRPQSEGVTLIEADRNNLGDVLKNYHFDAVLDINAYTAADIENLLDALDSFDNYVFISSSAVYPEYEVQPFKEETNVGENKFWGNYGTDKIAAEKLLKERVPNAYILRPPYLYGPMNNVYREAFVFDCALADRKFYLPKDGQLKLHFFHINDLCKVMEAILEKKPKNHIFNVGNKGAITIKEWAKMCYEVAGKTAEFVEVYKDINWRSYFSFSEYEYYLETTKQDELLVDTTDMKSGLKECFEWYIENREKVSKRPYLDFIDEHLK